MSVVGVGCGGNTRKRDVPWRHPSLARNTRWPLRSGRLSKTGCSATAAILSPMFIETHQETCFRGYLKGGEPAAARKLIPMACAGTRGSGGSGDE